MIGYMDQELYEDLSVFIRFLRGNIIAEFTFV